MLQEDAKDAPLHFQYWFYLPKIHVTQENLLQV